MSKVWQAIKVFIAGTVTVLESFFGGFDTGLGLLVILIFVDFLLGVINATVNKNVSSAEIRKGAVRKCVEFILILLCYRMDVVFGLLDSKIGGFFTLRLFSCVYFGVEEGISILENAGKLGVPLPRGVVKVLAQVPDAIEKSFTRGLVEALTKWLHIDLKDKNKDKKDNATENEVKPAEAKSAGSDLEDKESDGEATVDRQIK